MEDRNTVAECRRAKKTSGAKCRRAIKSYSAECRREIKSYEGNHSSERKKMQHNEIWSNEHQINIFIFKGFFRSKKAIIR